MSTLIPVHAAAHIAQGISSYLATSFSLADHATSSALRDFLNNPESGMFHGPYVRTRMPYAPAAPGTGRLSWSPTWFNPYYHQAIAFDRLKSETNTGSWAVDRQPEPTLVVTGTGSGKTESFLYPIIDHARRERSRGKPGVKAILLYPMNTLANDQASRLAGLLTSDPRLGSVSAGIYTGESREGGARSVTPESLITDRTRLREDPPDILLTNYKMLDQLLLRPADRAIWKTSAHSLQYLVLDEFHTYDGAQGTHVALLLRRLGLAIKDHAPERFTSGTPLGEITLVATSATLGDKRDPSKILEFAATIFGQELPADAVVTETMLDTEEWLPRIAEATGFRAQATPLPESPITDETVTRVNSAIAQLQAQGTDYVDALREIFTTSPPGLEPGTTNRPADLDAEIFTWARNPFFLKLLGASSAARPLTLTGKDEGPSLVESVLDTAVIRQVRLPEARTFIVHALSYTSDLRARFGAKRGFSGKLFPGVDTHLWVREVSRIDRRVGGEESRSAFRWADDGPTSISSVLPGAQQWLPACHCRNCGRSGWMITLEPRTDTPVLDGQAIRTRSLTDRERQRPLIDATSEWRAAVGTNGNPGADGNRVF